MAAESVAIDQWIYATLAADPTLAGLVGTRIYPDTAPPGATYPLVIYRMDDTTDWLEVGGDLGVVQPHYAVFGVDTTQSYLPLAPLATRIHAALQKQQGSAAGVQILMCLRRKEHRLKGYINGVGYCQLGGVYAIQAR